MKSIVIHAAKDLRIEDQASPVAGSGQVLVKLKSGGICGSDLHYYLHGGFGPIRLKESMTLGHEVAGEVVDLNGTACDLKVGQLVAISPSRPCYTCSYCQDGQHNQCLNMRFYGSAMPFPHIQGAFSEVVAADIAQCVPADGLTPGQAAMAEPLAVALHAIRRAGSLVGKSVLVTGCGPIGALVILAARRAGVAEIIATDLTVFALDHAKNAGADVVCNMADTPDALAEYQTGKGQIDVLFECSGAAPALVAGLVAVKAGGTVVQLGLGGDMTLPLQMMTAKEISWQGSFRFHSEFATAVQMMQKGLIDVSRLITHTVPLDDAVKGFELAADRSQTMKVQMTFG